MPSILVSASDARTKPTPSHSFETSGSRRSLSPLQSNRSKTLATGLLARASPLAKKTPPSRSLRHQLLPNPHKPRLVVERLASVHVVSTNDTRSRVIVRRISGDGYRLRVIRHSKPPQGLHGSEGSIVPPFPITLVLPFEGRRGPFMFVQLALTCVHIGYTFSLPVSPLAHFASELRFVDAPAYVIRPSDSRCSRSNYLSSLR